MIDGWTCLRIGSLTESIEQDLHGAQSLLRELLSSVLPVLIELRQIFRVLRSHGRSFNCSCC